MEDATIEELSEKVTEMALKLSSIALVDTLTRNAKTIRTALLALLRRDGPGEVRVPDV